MSDTSKARFDKIHASLDKIDERDKLARELARRLLVSPYYKILHPQARQLLKLYEEEKP